MSFFSAFFGFAFVLGLSWSWIALLNMWQQVPEYRSLDRNILKLGFGIVAVLSCFVLYFLF